MGEKWRSALANLGTWKQGGKRAVHKPLFLLYLLARVQEGKDRSLAYEEARPVLKEALRLFGPPRKAYHPEFPFWYLKNDAVWTIPQAALLAREAGSSDQPSSSLLLRKKAVGEIPLPYWKEIHDRPAELSFLVQTLLEEFWPSTYHQNIASYFGLDLSLDHPGLASTQRKRDPNFRIEVLRAYERKCAICGYDARLADQSFGLEAAHIKWFSHGGPDQACNGLALCSLHHVAFDQGAIGLTDKLLVQVSQDVVGSNAVTDAIVAFNGKPLEKPLTAEALPSSAFVKWHHSNVFRVPART